MLKTHNRHPSDLLHEETGVDWLGTGRARACCVEMYNLLHDVGPKNLCDKITVKAPCRALRSNVHLKLTSYVPKTKLGEGNILYRGAKYWDSLNEDIQHSKSLAIFKRKLKSEKTFTTGHFTNMKNLAYI